MNGSNSRALRMSGAAVIGLIALDLLLSAIVLGPRLNEEGAFTLLAILDMVIGAAALLLTYFMLRREFAAREQAEAGRGAAESRMSEVANVAPVAIIGADPQFRITSWNPAAEKLYGWTHDEVIGREVSTVLRSQATPEQRASAKEAVAARGEFVSEWVHLDKANNRRIVLGDTVTLRDNDGAITGYVSVNRDVTSTRLVEQELQESRARLQLIMDNIPAAISYVDRDECYVFANKGYERLLGLNPDEMVGRTIRELMRPDTYATGKPRLDAALAGEPQEFENTLPSADGGTFTGLVQFIPDKTALETGHGGVDGVFISVTDISRVRDAEAAAAASTPSPKRGGANGRPCSTT